MKMRGKAFSVKALLSMSCILGGGCGGGTIGSSGGSERSFTGSIVGTDGRPVGGALMELLSQRGGNPITASNTDAMGHFAMEASVGESAALRIQQAAATLEVDLPSLPPPPAKIGLQVRGGRELLRTDVQIHPNTDCDDLLSVGLTVLQTERTATDRLCHLSLTITDPQLTSLPQPVTTASRPCNSSDWTESDSLSVAQDGGVVVPLILGTSCRDHRITIRGAVPIELVVVGK